MERGLNIVVRDVCSFLVPISVDMVVFDNEVIVLVLEVMVDVDMTFIDVDDIELIVLCGVVSLVVTDFSIMVVPVLVVSVLVTDSDHLFTFSVVAIVTRTVECAVGVAMVIPKFSEQMSIWLEHPISLKSNLSKEAFDPSFRHQFEWRKDSVNLSLTIHCKSHEHFERTFW